MPGPTLFDFFLEKSLHAWSNVVRFFSGHRHFLKNRYMAGRILLDFLFFDFARKNFLGYNPTNTKSFYFRNFFLTTWNFIEHL